MSGVTILPSNFRLTQLFRCLLRHRPYLSILPSRDLILTPLYFSDGELELFRGTNLYQATIELRSSLERQFTSINMAVELQAKEIAQKMTLSVFVSLNSRSILQFVKRHVHVGCSVHQLSCLPIYSFISNTFVAGNKFIIRCAHSWCGLPQP